VIGPPIGKGKEGRKESVKGGRDNRKTTIHGAGPSHSIGWDEKIRSTGGATFKKTSKVKAKGKVYETPKDSSVWKKETCSGEGWRVTGQGCSVDTPRTRAKFTVNSSLNQHQETTAESGKEKLGGSQGV